MIEFGDCRDIMRRWASEGVKAQMCVTSPPYFGLRDYGHDGQIGLEETPNAYVAALVEVFRCVRDVLADDGVLWLNLGDSYAANRGYQVADNKAGDVGNTMASAVPAGLKPKDLIGIPWRVAFALQADGWWLRQDIIWAKPNPMPESVTDRCTKAHEYLFLLAKNERYFWNSEIMREDAVAGHNGSRFDAGKTRQAKPNHVQDGPRIDDGTRNRRSVWTIPTEPYSGAHFAVFPPALIKPCILAGSRPGDLVLDPFMGSGTTAAVAKEFGRGWLGCELNPAFKPLQDQRLAAVTRPLW